MLHCALCYGERETVASNMDLVNQPLVPLPLLPDFLVCDQIYGLGLRNIDCQSAIQYNFARGVLPITYAEGGQGYHYAVPFSFSQGS